jgi:hypothetical protein
VQRKYTGGTQQAIGIRSHRVRNLEVALKLSGDRVRERADFLLAGIEVLEHLEVGTEERLSVLDGRGKADPVAQAGKRLALDVVRCEPVVDGLQGL